ncbi:putative disease resistance protein [Morus notabilis]|uniref:Putative disease resistance protein n=1 Tax=Morus notabilis TaxID=981085 RepID=W9RLF4_9ROSA|nr:putative disease resistance RPP13-like protein 3 [Morus notabilis]XP_024025966.1 putative disease resistance RPP13-like protein 3 [Morus notabilis]EXB96191.1 putative disease resistance protein [Morus notabilis]
MALELVALKLAEAVVSQVVQALTDLLKNEAVALSSVKEDVEYLQEELIIMMDFLKDADKKQELDNLVRRWIAEVEDLACEIEDAIETFIYKVNSSYKIKAMLHQRELQRKIVSIKNKIEILNRRRQMYNIERSSGEGTNSSRRSLRMTYPDDDDEDDIITLKDTTAALKAQLMAEEDRLCVVSIVGMGGLGKTTLAKKVYNDVDVKKHFDCYAWVFVSQQCAPRDVWSEILMQVGFHSDQPERTTLGGKKYTRQSLEKIKNKRELVKDLDDHELAAAMRSTLQEKRYLIVLDDIWSIDAWHSVKKAFPKGKLGSKVVFTTRNEIVASIADPQSSPIKLPLLTRNESLELLKLKAFPKDDSAQHGCPLDLEEVGKQMVEKCGGLPVAIVVLGGLLRTKMNSLDGWKKVQKDVQASSINKLKSEKQYGVEDILDLSFQDLPYYLKYCFLYLGRFPEDSEIPKGKLIQLWIAEGFVPTTETEDAEQYLAELINRCMVQVGKREPVRNDVKTCRLHDLMRDFCMSKAKEEMFLEVLQPNEMNKFSTATRSRRIAINVKHDLVQHTRWVEKVCPHLCSLPNSVSTPWAEQVHSNLRSLLCYVPILSMRQKKFALLRVLELDFILERVTKLPKGIGNLIHLRYLRVSGVTKLRLPSIGNLRNLQTLDLANNDEVSLPSTMWRLRNLRHLLLPYRYSLPFWTSRPIFKNDVVTKLETLMINAKDLIRHNAVLPLRNIQALGIWDIRSDKEVTLVLESLNSQSQSSGLRTLTMYFWDGEFPKLELLSHCHVLLSLELGGAVSHENISFLPPSLTEFRIHNCMFTQDKIEVLEKMPNLRILSVNFDTSFKDRYKWVFSVDGFPKLEILELSFLVGLEEWKF